MFRQTTTVVRERGQRTTLREKTAGKKLPESIYINSTAVVARQTTPVGPVKKELFQWCSRNRFSVTSNVCLDTYVRRYVRGVYL